MKENKPNLFIVGAPKAGTSSLYSYLSKHPDIFVPEVKETHHFSCPEVKDTYYKVSFVESADEYLNLYKNAINQKWLGDFSPSCLFSPHAAQRIFDFNPDSRIIIVLRDPADRAVSHYLMDRRLGIQTKTLPESIKEKESNRLFIKEYMEMGKYYPQIKRYLDCFSREQVYLARYDELVTDPAAFISNILEFLGLESVSSIDTTRKHNPYRMPRSALLGRFYQSNVKQTIGKLFPQKLKQIARSAVYSNSKPDMQNEREVIRPYFNEDIDMLEGLTGWDLEKWKAHRT